MILNVWETISMMDALRWWGFTSEGDVPPKVTTVILKVHGYEDKSDDVVERLVLSEVESRCVQTTATFVVKPIRYSTGVPREMV